MLSGVFFSWEYRHHKPQAHELVRGDTTNHIFVIVFYSYDVSLDHSSYNDVLQVIQEKERKLTDAKLEALTTQHQLHQLQDQITQMQAS